MERNINRQELLEKKQKTDIMMVVVKKKQLNIIVEIKSL